MDEHKRSKGVLKAKRGGFSLSGFRLFQEKSQTGRQSNHVQDPLSNGKRRSTLSQLTGTRNSIQAAPDSISQEETKTHTRSTSFGIARQGSKTTFTSTSTETSKPQLPLPKDDLDDDESPDVEKDAAKLLNLFLTSPSSQSLPGSRDNASTAVSRKSPVPVSSSKQTSNTTFRDVHESGNARPLGDATQSDIDGNNKAKLILPAIQTPPNSYDKDETDHSARYVPQEPLKQQTFPSTLVGNVTENHKFRQGQIHKETAKSSPKERSLIQTVRKEKRHRVLPTEDHKQQPRGPVMISGKPDQSQSVETSVGPESSIKLCDGYHSGDDPVTATPQVAQQQINDRKSGSCSSTSASLVQSARSRSPKMPPKLQSPGRKAGRKLSLDKLPSRRLSPVVPDNFPLRRSTRSRGAPVNYFAPPPGFPGYHDDNNDVDNSPYPPKQKEKSPAPLSSHVSPKRRCKHRLVYSSDSIRILQLPVDDLQGIPMRKAPYCDAETRYNLKKYCSREEVPCVVLHVDFSVSEMNALYSILTLNPPPHDVPIIDLIIQCVGERCTSSDAIDLMAEHIKDLSRIYKILAPFEEQLLSFFLESRQGNTQRFSNLEQQAVRKLCRHLAKVLNTHVEPHPVYHVRLRNLLQKVDEDRLQLLTYQLQQAKALGNRERCSLANFLQDAKDGTVSLFPTALRALSKNADLHLDSLGFDQFHSLALLRSRELGYKVHRGGNKVQRNLSVAVAKWEVYKSWKGASNDVLEVCWSPDGTRFAAGAAAQCDEHNMQYNRNNNLLLGDLSSNRLRELPDHRIPRPSPNANAQQGTITTVDQNLYMTVSAVKWSNCGQRLYTSSYDQTVKVWDVSRHIDTTCIQTLRHPGKVHVMAISDLENGMIATGCENTPHFYLWSMSEDGYSNAIPLEISRKGEMVPTSLRWGSSPDARTFLVAGMSVKDSVDNHDPPKHGHLALWQVRETGVVVPHSVTPNSQNIFDIRWHPSMPIFATGSTIPTSAKSKGIARDTQSLVRIYEPTRTKLHTHEFECPALDMNDVTFCPTNSYYITANCTDGATYVWDFRNPNKILHKLKHGPPISELDPELTREQADVGVRLCLWGDETAQLFTGASDGVIKEWNILLAPEDALVSDVASFGQEITCGAFSPDKNNMMVGDACGEIRVLSNAPWTRSQDDDMSMIFEPADDAAPDTQNGGGSEIQSARETVDELLSSGKLVRHPRFGAVQGPCYDGPYAAWARSKSIKDDDLAKIPEERRNEYLRSLPLDPLVQATQFYGPPIQSRQGLDKGTRDYVYLQMQLAEYRNGLTSLNKRKREPSPLPETTHPSRAHVPEFPQIIELSSDDDESLVFYTPKARRVIQGDVTTPSRTKIIKREISSPQNFLETTCVDFVDLTGSDDETMDTAREEISLSPQKHAVDSDESSNEWAEEDNWWPTDVDPNLEGSWG
ncbi:hypothetical protein VTO42DRAFT_4664 [Malbranchea cinnamomea]